MKENYVFPPTLLLIQLKLCCLCGLLRRDLITLFSAFCTGFSAFLAMIILVLAAFGGAITTDLRAKNSDLLCVSFALCHEMGGGAAHFGTMYVQLNAFGHHFNIVFVQR
jgi:hypothetical protein